MSSGSGASAPTSKPKTVRRVIPALIRRQRVADDEARRPVWTWRDAIFKTDVPSSTKLVCLAIAQHLSDAGMICWPSVKTLMQMTGLSNTSIAKHLAAAESAGLVTIERVVGSDGIFAHNVYSPRFPAGFCLPSSPAEGPPPPENDETDPREETSRGSDELTNDDGDRPREAISSGPREEISRGPREDFAENHVKKLHAEHIDSEIFKRRAHARASGARVRVRGAGVRSIGELIPNVVPQRDPPASKPDLITRLKTDGAPEHVCDLFLRPLFGVLTFPPEADPAALLRAIADDLANCSDETLIESAKSVRAGRSRWPSPAQVLKLVGPIQSRFMKRIEPGTPEWEAWEREWRRAGNAFLVTHYRKQGFATVTRAYPHVGDGDAKVTQ